MSPSDVRDTLDNVCFVPGIWWDAESLAQFFGCSASKIGAIPGILRECAKSPEGVSQFEFEQSFLSTVQVANGMGKSRTAIARLKRHGRLNPRRGPNNSALFLVREVYEFNGWTIPDDKPIGAYAQSESLTKPAKQRSQESTNVQNGSTSAALRPAKPPNKTERLRALLIEDVRFFEQLEELPLQRSARDQWERFIDVRRDAIGAEAE